MIFLGDEVQFKSYHSAYWVEKSGKKNHTERLVTIEEEKWLKNHFVKRIRISKAEEPILYFTREITNIWKEGDMLGYSLYSFTWKHEMNEVLKG